MSCLASPILRNSGATVTAVTWEWGVGTIGQQGREGRFGCERVATARCADFVATMRRRVCGKGTTRDNSVFSEVFPRKLVALVWPGLTETTSSLGGEPPSIRSKERSTDWAAFHVAQIIVGGGAHRHRR